MLSRITISNYLLIEELDLAWSSGMTAITGETGSGKSILVGALELAMGARADAGLARDPEKRCIIELELDLSKLALQDWFAERELPYESRTLVRRQLDPSTSGGAGGRSRAFINDTPVRLEQLRELGERLIHVHSQHHTLLLNDARFQLSLVDQLAGQEEAVEELRAIYSAWRKAEDELTLAREQEQRALAEADYLRFQLDELEQAKPLPGEIAEIERELQLADNAGERAEAFRAVEEACGGDEGALPALQKARAGLAKAARVDQEAAELLRRLDSSIIEMKDIAQESAALAVAVELDPARAEQLRDRVDLLNRLEQKHRVQGSEGLIALLEELRSRSVRIGAVGETRAEAEVRVTRFAADYDKSAKAVSKARTKAIKPLANQVESLLHQLGMPHAVFQFDHRTCEPGPWGIDQIRALFSANKDRAPAPLDKVASGGELSRVMLALISLAAGSRDLPIVLFDEIDTGVSGEVADRVGAMLAEMGRSRQIIAITHLPQIASKATSHLEVTKASSGDRVRTSIKHLAHEARVEAIARMLSGRKVSEQALENARVLLEQA